MKYFHLGRKRAYIDGKLIQPFELEKIMFSKYFFAQFFSSTAIGTLNHGHRSLLFAHANLRGEGYIWVAPSAIHTKVIGLKGFELSHKAAIKGKTKKNVKSASKAGKGKQKIVPHLWFDKEAEEAAVFYTSIFKNSRIKNTFTIHNTPSGDSNLVTIELMGQNFMLISAGPYFKFTPAISFLVVLSTKEEVDAAWTKFADGGAALMELGEYSFSEMYGWIKDKYGLSWQLMYNPDPKVIQRITPTLMFVGNVSGKAEEAIKFYASVFHDAKVDGILRYGKGEEPDKEGTIKHAEFTLEDIKFAAMDSAREHDFTFNEAVSLIVDCETQAEIDYYWEKLSADPKAEQCGWLKDKYGVSWQITPTAMDKMMRDKNEKRVARVTEAFLKMKKFDLAALQRVYEGQQ